MDYMMHLPVDEIKRVESHEFIFQLTESPQRSGWKDEMFCLDFLLRLCH